MALSIRDAQARLLASGKLNNIGSNPSDKLPFDSVAEEIIEYWAEQSFLPAIKKSITDKGLNASKDLLQSVAHDVVTRGSNIVRFRLLMAEHWQYAEHGRKAGKRPPLKAIEQWITFKGIQVRQSKSESRLSVLQRRRKLARSIQFAIGKRGTIKRFNHKGSKFLQSVAPAQMTLLSDLMTKATGEVVIVSLINTIRKGQGR